ncbi:response regulator transcription factor [Thermobifida alba]|uniref:Response regulator transcription factor n=1 Tax=Thermobifida alba TaxID=53522 RepID=A0ABY4KXD1_THEAE|nr:response regulator transcription factor [Thermobifida alba]UPT20086.1 response regulator transcription factor [Thermobifida alba]HLU96916.1 response regulator transcription factor [Thermobifida alba]
MRVVIAEDSALLREGLAQLVALGGHEVVATVGDAPGLLAAVAEHEPDVVVTDVRMPPGHEDDGLRAAVRLTRTHPGVAILVLSQYVMRATAAELLESATAGVGYLLKDRVGDVAEFLRTLERVAAGGTAVDREVVRRLLGRHRNRSALDRLSPREREVLGLMAQGRSNAAIARALVITEAAVAKHVSGIFAKLGLPVAPEDNRRVLAVLTYLGA